MSAKVCRFLDLVSSSNPRYRCVIITITEFPLNSQLLRSLDVRHTNTYTHTQTYSLTPDRILPPEHTSVRKAGSRMEERQSCPQRMEPAKLSLINHKQQTHTSQKFQHCHNPAAAAQPITKLQIKGYLISQLYFKMQSA